MLPGCLLRMAVMSVVSRVVRWSSPMTQAVKARMAMNMNPVAMSTGSPAMSAMKAAVIPAGVTLTAMMVLRTSSGLPVLWHCPLKASPIGRQTLNEWRYVR